MGYCNRQRRRERLQHLPQRTLLGRRQRYVSDLGADVWDVVPVHRRNQTQLETSRPRTRLSPSRRRRGGDLSRRPRRRASLLPRSPDSADAPWSLEPTTSARRYKIHPQRHVRRYHTTNAAPHPLDRQSDVLGCRPMFTVASRDEAGSVPTSPSDYYRRHDRAPVDADGDQPGAGPLPRPRARPTTDVTNQNLANSINNKDGIVKLPSTPLTAEGGGGPGGHGVVIVGGKNCNDSPIEVARASTWRMGTALDPEDWHRPHRGRLDRRRRHRPDDPDRLYLPDQRRLGHRVENSRLERCTRLELATRT